MMPNKKRGQSVMIPRHHQETKIIQNNFFGDKNLKIFLNLRLFPFFYQF
jgi:hypothetical protein